MADDREYQALSSNGSPAPLNGEENPAALPASSYYESLHGSASTGAVSTYSAASMDENGGHEGKEPGSGKVSFTSEFLNWKEMKTQVLIAGPMIFVNLFNLCIQLISVMFVGHLGELALSRSTIATSFANVVGVSVVTGMATALDTLCGQAYGAKQYSLMGIYLQRALLVLNLTAIPLAFIFAFVGEILQALGQNAEISRGAGDYARLLIPVLFAMACSQAHVRFLLAQSLVFPMTATAFITLLCHLPICYVLVYRTGLGNRGAAIATSISTWIYAALVVLYVNFSESCRRTRSPPSREAFRDLKKFIQLALPSAAMICLEWWSIEILVLLAGLLPNPTLAASTLSICMNTAATLFQIPFGIGAAVSTRVSNELGGGRPDVARASVKVALRMAIAESVTLAVVLVIARRLIGRIYSSDDDVISHVAALVPLMACSTLLDAIQATLSGVARGCGLQKIGAAINLGSYYLVGIPIGCCVAFLTPLGPEGLWLSAICAPFVQATSFAILVWKIDWDQQALQAADRVEGSLIDPLLLN